MNVPAWPMPTQNTKLMIANAHPTGTLVPHTPMPVATVYAASENSISVPAAQIPNAVHQWSPRDGAMRSNRSLTGAPAGW